MPEKRTGPQRSGGWRQAGDFASRWKAARRPRRKIVGGSHCRSGPADGRSPSRRRKARSLSVG